MRTIGDSIYGMRIVPNQDENGLPFGSFEGVVITSTECCGNNIEIVRVVKEGDSYHTVDWIKVPLEETLAHTTSGKAKADFLISKAKEFAKENEKIAFCSNVAFNFPLLDETWDSLQRQIQESRS